MANDGVAASRRRGRALVACTAVVALLLGACTDDDGPDDGPDVDTGEQTDPPDDAADLDHDGVDDGESDDLDEAPEDQDADVGDDG